MYETTEMWKPTSFEFEMMDMQPDCDLVFGESERNPLTLAPFNVEKEINCLYSSKERRQFPDDTKSKSIAIISKMQELIPDRKILGRPMTEEDIDDFDRERETLAMIRNIGIQSSSDGHLNSNKTLPTITKNVPYKISNGRPLLFSEEYFKLQPRVKNLNSSESKPHDETSDYNSERVDLKEHVDSDENNIFEKKTFKEKKTKRISVAEQLLVKNASLSKDYGKVTDVPQMLTFKKNFYSPKFVYDKKRQSSTPNL